MELRHVRYFVAVGRCLSFTKAAELLHISQPPLSRQIQEFEEEVGAVLFDRRARKTTLTEAGAYLLEEAERFLEGLEAACKNARAISKSARNIKIASASFMMGRTLAPFLQELRERQPDLAIELLVLSTEAQERALFAGAIDVGFCRSWISREGIVFDRIGDEELVVVYPGCEHPAGSLENRFENLSHLPYIAISSASAKGLADAVKSACLDFAISPTPAYECNDAHSILGLVSAGLGWAIVPDYDIGDLADARVGCFGLPRRIEIGLAYREGSLSAHVDAFLRIAKSHFAKKSKDDMGSDRS